MVPHSEQVEIDFTTNLTKATTSGGDASALLESLPATAVVGFASPEFGKSFGEGIDALDESGIAGQIEPGELKGAMELAGINLDSIAAIDRRRRRLRRRLERRQPRRCSGDRNRQRDRSEEDRLQRRVCCCARVGPKASPRSAANSAASRSTPQNLARNR